MQQLSGESHKDAVNVYADAGVARARSLGNRGPLRYDSNGAVSAEILHAYNHYGFYVFENLIDSAEIDVLRLEFAELIDRAPVDNGADLDIQGRPAFGREFARNPYTMIRPLSDPWGGTTLLGGRHPTKMSQPKAAQTAPKKVVFVISGMCQLSEAALRLYGHADILSIAENINGTDFVPYNDATFVKQPGLGGAVSWHQDGVTHWDSPAWDDGIHGFNVQVQLYECTAQNCLWVLPGTHTQGRIDIPKLVREQGEYLEDAVPLLCQPGDITIVNRQVLHGSFANTSDQQRISITFGFHRYASILGAKGALSQTNDETYSHQRIDERSAVIQVAIDARAQFYPEQPVYRYTPFVGREDELRHSAENIERVIKNYNLKDLSI